MSEDTETVKGVVEFVKQNDYGFYSIKVDGEWYGTGSKKAPGAEKGDKVSFDFYLQKGKYKTLQGKIKNLGKAEVTSKASTGASTSDGYWAEKTKYEQEVLAPRLARQFAIGQANAFIENAIAAGTLASLLKGKDSLDTLRALLIDTANELVAFANGPKAAPATAAKDEEEQHVEDESEELEE